MIGNDVVDIEVAARQSNWERKGFLEKVFSEEERSVIFASADQNQMVWLFWSMKEAAYKAHQRKFKLIRKLNWLQQKCEISSLFSNSASGIVRVEGERYFTNSNISSRVIHTSAVIQKNIPLKKVLLETSSEAIKRELLRHVETCLSKPGHKLVLKKNMHGVPYISYNDRLLFARFSLSSHGNFSGFSMSLRMS